MKTNKKEIYYEKKYKEALGWMQSLYNGLHGKTKEEAEKYFPELKESEDEKIRKELIDAINGLWVNDALPLPLSVGRKDKWIAWLEKQGKQKVPINDFKAKNWYVSEVDGKIHDMTYNPADKVEPKFHEGDWVVYMGTTAKILDLQKHCYVGKDVNDKDFVASYCNECEMKKWTIQDAKDGDVLAAYECYVIFKEIDGLNIKCHCTYHYMGLNPSFHINTLQNKTAFHPATKEECEKLFKKMKEEGYEWDAEKKELKKIEQKPVNDTVETIVEAVSNTSILDMIEDKDAFTNPSVFENSLGRLLKLFEKLPKQDLLDGLKFYANVVKHDGEYVKPTEWSEDDERIVTALMEGFRYHQLFNPRFGEVPNAEIISWIKSLKERLS